MTVNNVIRLGFVGGIFYILIVGLLCYGLASAVVSGVKAISGQCGKTLAIDSYVSSNLFCEVKK